MLIQFAGMAEAGRRVRKKKKGEGNRDVLADAINVAVIEAPSSTCPLWWMWWMWFYCRWELSR